MQNVIAALLCAFQIIEIGAGSTFNVEEKDFIDGLYQVTQLMMQAPSSYSTQDFLAFLKCTHLVMIERKQFSTEILTAFTKRLAQL